MLVNGNFWKRCKNVSLIQYFSSGDSTQICQRRVNEDSKLFALNSSGHQATMPVAEAILYQMAGRYCQIIVVSVGQ